MRLDVPVTGGVVRGEAADDLAVFRGIPYADLPARFGSPQAPHPWDGIRQATRFGPPPPQYGLGPDSVDGDWLTINVWSPDLGGGLPVMVWIQGGAYLFGASGVPEFDGSTLARGGVVLVTFNYRVGFEGFGYLEGAPANRGLLDQLAALEWVRRNIRRFGGDPDRVTVFGQSAGAGCAAALLAMPRATGLFGRVIAQSVPSPYFTPRLAADIARVCAAEAGLSPAELPAADPGLLHAACIAVLGRLDEHADRWGRAAHGDILFAPVIDGDLLPSTPWRGLTGRVDLMVGHTRHEQRLLTFMKGKLGRITEADAIEAARCFAPDPQQYLDGFADPQELYDVVRSDWLFRMPSLHLAQAQHAAGGKAYLYELTWPAPGLDGALGACHGLDVPLVFGNLTAGQPAMLIGPPTPEAMAISAQLRAAWTAFATYGDPGWPAYDEAALTRLFDVEPAVTAYPEQVSRRIWRDAPAALDLQVGDLD